jgi:putative FmdB family regulatory protein
MPLYDYKCLKCGKESLLALTLKEHESGAATCPSCGSKELEQLITSFIARTSSKS